MLFLEKQEMMDGSVEVTDLKVELLGQVLNIFVSMLF